jgi:hypothetical protein
MNHLFSLAAPFVLVLLAGCAERQIPNAGALESDARAFMESYAQDLRDHDAEGVADRYHSSGAYFRGGFMDKESIRQNYTSGWQGPASFVWEDLSFEVLGPEAILVAGTGIWGLQDTTRFMQVLYASVLTGDDGDLRIRVEDETVVEQ